MPLNGRGGGHLLLYVLLCVLLHRVPLQIRVSPETHKRLQVHRTQRHLNVGSGLRALCRLSR